MGIPATLVLEHQTQTQLKALLDQADHTTQALLDNKLNQLDNLAVLLVQRPTLKSLLAINADSETLQTYLGGIQSSSGFDAILICDGETLVASASSETPSSLCEAPSSGNILSITGTAWMVTHAQLANGNYVVVGQQLSGIFEEFTTQSGLDYAFTLTRTWSPATCPFKPRNLLASSQTP